MGKAEICGMQTVTVEKIKWCRLERFKLCLLRRVQVDGVLSVQYRYKYSVFHKVLTRYKY